MPTVTHIRSFRNADLPRLLEVWIQHWSAIGPPPKVDLARLEQAVLARTFFDPAGLLLAESEAGVEAWSHAAVAPDADDCAVMTAFCAMPSSGSEVTVQLLEATERHQIERGARRVLVGVVRDDQFGYAGLDPIGHGIGVDDADGRTGELLQRSGYEPESHLLRMSVSTAGYRPPVNRESLQFRRSTTTQTHKLHQQQPPRAAAMSHLDIEAQLLIDRGGTELARLDFWFSDAEAEVMDPCMAIVDLREAHRRGHMEPAESYLLAASIPLLGGRRIETLETSVDADKAELAGQLESLRFHTVQRGTRWQKSLATPPS